MKILKVLLSVICFVVHCSTLHGNNPSNPGLSDPWIKCHCSAEGQEHSHEEGVCVICQGQSFTITPEVCPSDCKKFKYELVGEDGTVHYSVEKEGAESGVINVTGSYTFVVTALEGATKGMSSECKIKVVDAASLDGPRCFLKDCPESSCYTVTACRDGDYEVKLTGNITFEDGSQDKTFTLKKGESKKFCLKATATGRNNKIRVCYPGWGIFDSFLGIDVSWNSLEIDDIEVLCYAGLCYYDSVEGDWIVSGSDDPNFPPETLSSCWLKNLELKPYFDRGPIDNESDCTPEYEITWTIYDITDGQSKKIKEFKEGDGLESIANTIQDGTVSDGCFKIVGTICGKSFYVIYEDKVVKSSVDSSQKITPTLYLEDDSAVRKRVSSIANAINDWVKLSGSILEFFTGGGTLEEINEKWEEFKAALDGYKTKLDPIKITDCHSSGEVLSGKMIYKYSSRCPVELKLLKLEVVKMLSTGDTVYSDYTFFDNTLTLNLNGNYGIVKATYLYDLHCEVSFEYQIGPYIYEEEVAAKAKARHAVGMDLYNSIIRWNIRISSAIDLIEAFLKGAEATVPPFSNMSEAAQSYLKALKTGLVLAVNEYAWSLRDYYNMLLKCELEIAESFPQREPAGGWDDPNNLILTEDPFPEEN